MRVRSQHRAPAERHQAPAPTNEPPLPSSFVALLLAIETVSSTPSKTPSKPPAAEKDASSEEGDAKLAARRERNRIACRKARLTRKLRRLGETLRVRQREQWRAYLLDLRDQQAHTAPGPATAVLKRAFLVRSLHECLVDDEYNASKQSTRARVPGWPSRKIFAAMERQWQQLAGDLLNAELTVKGEMEMASAGDPSTIVLECEWTLSGVCEGILTSHARIEPKLFRGTTMVLFVNDCVTTIEFSATGVENPFAGGSDDASEDDGDK